MPTYLNEQFYRNVKKEINQYMNNYDYIKERSIIIENQEHKRIIEAEKKLWNIKTIWSYIMI